MPTPLPPAVQARARGHAAVRPLQPRDSLPRRRRIEAGGVPGGWRQVAVCRGSGGTLRGVQHRQPWKVRFRAGGAGCELDPDCSAVWVCCASIPCPWSCTPAFRVVPLPPLLPTLLLARSSCHLWASALQTTSCEVHTFDCTYNGASQRPGRHFYHSIWCVTEGPLTCLSTPASQLHPPGRDCNLAFLASPPAAWAPPAARATRARALQNSSRWATSRPAWGTPASTF